MNENPSTNNPTIRKTQVICLWDRQRRMLDFYNLPGTMYVALGKTSAWADENDSNISDTYPPMPSETMTDIEEMIGMQRIQWKKFAKVYVNPTSEEKDDKDTIYYKGLYYKTTNDVDKAIAEGYTTVMLMMTSDRDQYFPVGIAYRQVGVYVMVDETDRYLSYEQFKRLGKDRQGHLAAVENFMPLTRQLDQLEKHFVAFDF